MSVGRNSHASVVCNGVIYSLGGQTDENRTLDIIER